MFDSPLMLLVGTCLFMVIGFVVCVVISIFCDSINLSGSFYGLAEKVIAVAFIPIIAAGGALDLVISPFYSADIKNTLDQKL